MANLQFGHTRAAIATGGDGARCRKPLGSVTPVDDHRLVARAADHPEPVERWIRTALHDATQTNAGQRLTRPAALGAWLGTALDLRPAERWQAEAVLPPGLEDLPAAWAGLLPPDLPLTRRPSAAGASVVLRLRLRAPEPPAGGNGTPASTPASSWAGSLRHAAHLAAIFLRSRV
ncbi:MAG: hypothetical protein JNK88_01320 [Mangrovicoccus sp.]|nr:hypothetical protein [Mangrovicoccus sp.]